MRARDEVLERFREMRARKLKEMKRLLLAKSPANCVHNVRLNVKDVGKVGICQNPEILKCRGKPLVCNDAAFAERCKDFCCLHTDDTVESQFDEILRSPARCGEEQPKLAMLIWFLQGEDDTLSSSKRLQKHLSTICSECRKVLTLKWLV